MSKEITGGSGPFIGEAVTPNLKKLGYVQHEYLASGTATAYKAKGQLTRDGRWSFAPDAKAAYRTRVLVRRPANPADFSGTVVVEWNNVSGGVDADPDYTSFGAELTRHGDAWVGVSAQIIGVEGGPVLVAAPGAGSVAGKGLKKLDPARYGSLHHPGDGYSFDIFTQVARALRQGGPALGGVDPKKILAAGESQSAFALTTYYNGVQPLTRAFDGFLVHSRASGILPLVGPGKSADIAGSFGSTTPIFRTDLDAPVLDVQSEADVTGILDSVAVRQPDNDRFRLWEVAGTAHADVHLLGPIAKLLKCGAPINNAPMYLVVNAALHHLDDWVSSGTAPPEARRLELTSGSKPVARRDADGIALGGIRTPPVDVPVDVLSGIPGSNPDLLCILLGSTKPLPAVRLAQLYPSRATYQQRYDADADKVIRAGFVLAADRAALIAFAQPLRIMG
ncbi:MAG: hypothetical protein QOG50_2468 [Actinomycetota bacterium]|nr:hypothetical protein [Actinomycetota bacterium]